MNVVERWAEAIGRGELVAEHFHPDVEIVNIDSLAVTATYRGHDGLRRWWADMEEAISDLRMDVMEITQLDRERFLTIQRMIGTFRTAEIPVDTQWASVLTVSAGRITRAVGYVSKQKALRAVELESRE